MSAKDSMYFASVCLLCMANYVWFAKWNRAALGAEKLEMEAIRRGYAELVIVDHEIVFQWKESDAEDH